MRLSKSVLIVIYFQLHAVIALSQNENSGKSNYTRSRYNARILCPGESKYPYYGFGIKLGDPFALTYKFYAGKHISIVADLGKASSGLYSSYYKNKFDDYVNRDTLTSGASLSYLTTRIKSDWVGELKILYSFDAKVISPGLQIYVGLGLQGKRTQLQYTYQYSIIDVGMFERSRRTLGQTTVAGIEYNYSNVPISAFLEVELFTDIYIDPGLMRFQGGVGLRYNFR